MKIKISKNTVSSDFLALCEQYKVAETARTITVLAPLTPAQQAKILSGQLSKKEIKENIHFWIY